jgi:hypothetical protein
MLNFFFKFWIFLCEKFHYVYCLQFYVRLGLESPLDERQIIEDSLSFGTSSMLQTWLGATMFIIYMSSTRVLVWVKGRAEQKCSLTFYVFGQTRSKCFSSSTFLKLQPQQNLFAYGMRFHAPNTTSSCVLPH